MRGVAAIKQRGRGSCSSISSSKNSRHLGQPQFNVKRCSCLPAAAGGGFRVSTSDATQALLCTLVNDLRGRSLVPTSSDMITVNAGGAGWGHLSPR